MKRTKWLMLLAVLALVVAACGYSDTSSDTTASSGGGESGGNAQGQDLYKATCAACHGQNAEGIDGLGNPLANSDFVKSMSDDELVTFIVVGRLADDPDNTTGVDMPPKGNNSALTDDDVQDIVDYLRTLN